MEDEDGKIIKTGEPNRNFKHIIIFKGPEKDWLSEELETDIGFDIQKIPYSERFPTFIKKKRILMQDGSFITFGDLIEKFM